MNIDAKYKRLQDLIKGYQKVVLAFSGGVDSTLLAKVCNDILGPNAMAVTVKAVMHPESETDEAVKLADIIGIKHTVIDLSDLEIKGFNSNPHDRCYICKKAIFRELLKTAEEHKITVVLEGSNIDDLSDYRPGMKAIRELNVISPLKEAGLTKNEIRELSRKLELPTFDKPSFPCLATRFPFGEQLTTQKFIMLEKAENYLKEQGLKQFRVRYHNGLARIAVFPAERPVLFDTGLMDRISVYFKSIGFEYVTMDLAGYKMGEMNTGIKKTGN